ncbi:MAG TPA: helix-hairpin-helix domain-containing protein [Gemmatirosa sp.]
MRFLALPLALALATAGSAVRAQPAAPAAKPTAAAKPAASAAKADPIDINTASKADLQSIPGIGDVYAAKIIAARPYHSKDELTRKKVLPAGVYAKVKDRLIARQH